MLPQVLNDQTESDIVRDKAQQFVRGAAWAGTARSAGSNTATRTRRITGIAEFQCFACLTAARRAADLQARFRLGRHRRQVTPEEVEGLHGRLGDRLQTGCDPVPRLTQRLSRRIEGAVTTSSVGIGSDTLGTRICPLLTVSSAVRRASDPTAVAASAMLSLSEGGGSNAGGTGFGFMVFND